MDAYSKREMESLLVKGDLTDSLIEKELGDHLRHWRASVSCSIYAASKATKIPQQRIKDLEAGTAEPCLKMREAIELGKLYNVPFRVIVEKAKGN